MSQPEPIQPLTEFTPHPVYVETMNRLDLYTRMLTALTAHGMYLIDRSKQLGVYVDKIANEGKLSDRIRVGVLTLMADDLDVLDELTIKPGKHD